MLANTNCTMLSPHTVVDGSTFLIEHRGVVDHRPRTLACHYDDAFHCGTRTCARLRFFPFRLHRHFAMPTLYSEPANVNTSVALLGRDSKLHFGIFAFWANSYYALTYRCALILARAGSGWAAPCHLSLTAAL